MASEYKPDNYPTMSPYLVVDGADRTIQFLTDVFLATELRRFCNPQGQVIHAEVRLDDGVIMLGDQVEDWPARPAHVHIYVPDVDATYQKALEWGATSVQAPTKKDDDDKRGGVSDPGGTTWWIATKVE
ncbi:VOC family protein [Leptolyngbya sp. PCC 6406]|uniref:VOC family protein n=1 Tax=Leptolyngbya sp. PCC 6406 TaxID=1173264 RepID=UPI0002ABE263|nr:VOC family protein [Leptolyngbya sp. PCC 6406]